MRMGPRSRLDLRRTMAMGSCQRESVCVNVSANEEVYDERRWVKEAKRVQSAPTTQCALVNGVEDWHHQAGANGRDTLHVTYEGSLSYSAYWKGIEHPWTRLASSRPPHGLQPSSPPMYSTTSASMLSTSPAYSSNVHRRTWRRIRAMSGYRFLIVGSKCLTSSQ